MRVLTWHLSIPGSCKHQALAFIPKSPLQQHLQITPHYLLHACMHAYCCFWWPAKSTIEPRVVFFSFFPSSLNNRLCGKLCSVCTWFACTADHGHMLCRLWWCSSSLLYGITPWPNFDWNLPRFRSGISNFMSCDKSVWLSSFTTGVLHEPGIWERHRRPNDATGAMHGILEVIRKLVPPSLHTNILSCKSRRKSGTSFMGFGTKSSFYTPKTRSFCYIISN